MRLDMKAKSLNILKPKVFFPPFFIYGIYIILEVILCFVKCWDRWPTINGFLIYRKVIKPSTKSTTDPFRFQLISKKIRFFFFHKKTRFLLKGIVVRDSRWSRIIANALYFLQNTRLNVFSNSVFPNLKF